MLCFDCREGDLKINQKIKNFYKQVSFFTNPGAYKDYFVSLTDNIEELRFLVSEQHLHKMRLYRNYDKRYVSKNFVWINCLYDSLNTATAMTGEIFRLDNNKGFKLNKPIEKRIIVTCRYMSILFASVLKAKGIPCRCRSGFAPYIYQDYNVDHWINEYWCEAENRWVGIDCDIKDLSRCWDKTVNLCDVGSKFDYPANLWLKARRGQLDNLEKYLKYTSYKGLDILAYTLFLDFNALMNIELPYRCKPIFIDSEKFFNLTEAELTEIDNLATLMLDPDKNFDKLKEIWETNDKFRILSCNSFNPYLDIK